MCDAYVYQISRFSKPPFTVSLVCNRYVRSCFVTNQFNEPFKITFICFPRRLSLSKEITCCIAGQLKAWMSAFVHFCTTFVATFAENGDATAPTMTRHTMAALSPHRKPAYRGEFPTFSVIFHRFLLTPYLTHFERRLSEKSRSKMLHASVLRADVMCNRSLSPPTSIVLEIYSEMQTLTKDMVPELLVILLCIGFMWQ